MKQSQENYKRIVIKIGSSLLYAEETESDCFSFPLEGLGKEIIDLMQQGKEIVLVSSGAIATGMRVLKMKSRPKETSLLQAAAAVGQHVLMSQYRRFFDKKGVNCAQLLLTWDDFDDRRRYLNAKNTLLTLLKLKCVPVINENDTVSVDEIRFGDNDKLSALVSGLISADLLIILSDVEGLLDKNGNLVRLVEKITPELRALACPTNKQVCVGGMVTKIDAAKIAVDSGIACVIANGRGKNIISSVLKNPEGQGTFFVGSHELTGKERWIAFGTKPKGRIIVDDGAKKALLSNKSLLSVGITGIEGRFDSSDVVSIVDRHNREFARGKVAVSSSQLERIKGVRSDKEVVHCDNIAVTG